MFGKIILFLTIINGISCCPSQPEIKKEMKNKQDRFYLRNEIKELRQAVSQNLKELTVEKLEQLVKGKKDINPTILDAHCGATILHLAAISGKLPIVKFYTNRLEDPNPQMEGQLWDCSGYTPLHLAAVHGHLDIVKHYFNLKIKQPKAANGNTPLHEASKAGWIPMVEFMVDRISDITPKNEEGETPKDLAEKSGHKKIVEILQNEESKRG